MQDGIHCKPKANVFFRFNVIRMKWWSYNPKVDDCCLTMKL